MTVKPFSRLNYNARNYNVVSAVMVPTYSVSASSSSINEGTAVTYTITTQYVLDGTVLYWTTSGTTTSSDFSDGVVSGSITMTNNTATVVRTLTSDIITEGAETIVFELRTGSISGTIVASTPSGTVNDTSVLTITPSTSSVNEGSSVTWTISAVGFGTGTLYYTNSGTTSSSDFTDGLNSGSIAITADSGTLTKTLQNDLNTEGSETIIIQIRTVSTSGTIVGTSTTVTVADTSVSTQAYSVKFQSANSQYLQVAANAAFVPAAGNFTIEAWVYLFNYGSTRIGIANNWNGGGAWNWQITNSGFIEFNYTNIPYGISTIQTTGTTKVVPLNQWCHIAVVRNGATLTFYVNGSADATTRNIGSDTIYYYNSNTKPLVIGADSDFTTGNYLNGYISNFRMVKGTAIYTANFNPPTDNLSAVSGTSILVNGSSIADSSSNSFSITNGNTAVVRMENPFGNYSTYFPSGAGSNYVVPHSSSLDFDTGDFTVEFWMYAISMPNAAGIIGKKESDSTNGWQITYNSTYPTNRMSIRLTQQIDVTSTSSWTLNTWEHWAVTRSGTTVRWFKNGVLDSTGTNSSNIAENRSVYIGYSETWGGYFTGYLSNIRVVKGTALYTSSFTLPTSALTAISGTSLLTCQYSEIMDASTNHASITAVVPRPINQNPFGSYYASFNGSNQALTIPPSTVFNGMGSVNCTFEAWVCPTAYYALRQNIVTRWGNGGMTFQFSLYGNIVRLTGNYGSAVTGTTTLSSYKWYHVAAVYNGSNANATIYVNGVSEGSGTLSSGLGDTDGTVNVAIGAYNDLNAEWYNGYISNLRIVKGTAIYSGSSFTIPTTPLTAVSGTILLTCQSSGHIDNSTSVLAITNNNSVKNYLTDIFTGIVSGVNYAQKNYSLKILPASSAVTTVSATQPAALSGDFTVECWFYMDYTLGSPPTLDGSTIAGTGATVGGAFTIAGNGSSASAGWSINLYLDGISWARPGYATNFQFVPSGGTYGSRYFQENTWYHLAICRSGTTWTCYINGVLATNRTATNYSITTTALTIGGIFSQTQWNFWGYISNFRIVNGLAVYTGAFTPPTSPLRISQSAGTNITAITTQTQILTAQYNTLFDASNNKLALTKVGSPDMVNVYPFPT